MKSILPCRNTKSHLINGSCSFLERRQGLKPLFFKSLNVAAEAAIHKAYLRWLLGNNFCDVFTPRGRKIRRAMQRFEINSKTKKGESKCPQPRLLFAMMVRCVLKAKSNWWTWQGVPSDSAGAPPLPCAAADTPRTSHFAMARTRPPVLRISNRREIYLRRKFRFFLARISRPSSSLMRCDQGSRIFCGAGVPPAFLFFAMHQTACGTLAPRRLDKLFVPRYNFINPPVSTL